MRPPRSPRTLGESVAELVRLARFAGAAALAESLGVLSTLLRTASAATGPALLEGVQEACAEIRTWIEDSWLADEPHRFLWELADLTLATVVGLVRHNVLFDPRGLDAIEDYECREWLRLNGASLRALQAPYIRGLYDLSMGYEDGDLNRPRLSAGQGVRGSLRTFFGYRGAFMWRMRAGMGDVVFAPLYEALRRGVGFEFFHRLTNVGLPPARPEGSAAQDWVQSLTFDVQARTRDGAAYAPLVDVAGRPCWPSQPDFAQLQDGERLAAEGCNFESHWDRRRAGELTLEVTKDFDLVVLGVGLGVIPHICPEILARDERWRRMTQEVKTIASQAFQVWLTEDLESLGWPGPAYITGAFAKPFDTWCDMAHVVPEEAWAVRPKTSVYFCAVLPDPPQPPGDDDVGYPARRAEEVRENAVDFLAGPIQEAWPQAFGADGQFRWDILAASGEDAGKGPGTVRNPILAGQRQSLGSLRASYPRELPSPDFAARHDLRQFDHCRRLDG